MLNTLIASKTNPVPPTALSMSGASPDLPVDGDGRTSAGIADTLMLLRDRLVPERRIVHAGDTIYRPGEAFSNLYVLNTGFFKIVRLTADGREQVVSLKFRGDWMGFDGIARDAYGCEAIAMDTGELWTIPYAALIAGCVDCPELLTELHEAMSREIGQDRDSLVSACTLPADARVAEFLRYFSATLAARGMRSDQICLRMTRAEIGNYLGMTLESVSRALSKLARDKVIAFVEKGRRDILIPDPRALIAFTQRCVVGARVLQ